MFATLTAWLGLQLSTVGLSLLTAVITVLTSHKAALFFVVVFGLAMFLASSKADRLMIVLSVGSAYVMGSRYPL